MGTSARTKITRGRGKTFVRRVIEAVSGATAKQPKRPPSPFEPWNFDRISDAIDEAFENQTIDVSLSGEGNVTPAVGQPFFYPRRTFQNPIIVNRLFFRGDHWQNGDGWIGPHPEQTNPAFNETMQEIANIFTSKNVVREATMRHALGVVGRNMQWGFAPVDDAVDEQGKPPEEVINKITEATKLIRPWLQSRKVQTMLRDAVCTLLLSERAGIQLVIPPGLADKDGEGNLVIEAASIGEALNYIYPEHPLPDNAAVIQDKDTRMEAGVWRYTKNEEDDDTALGEGGDTIVRTSDEEINYVAVCFIDEIGETVIRVYEEESEEVFAESTLEMGGRIPMFEMRRAALITLQVQQGQRALNLAESMIPRTAVTAGFLERLIIDGQLPGEPELDGEGNETGRWIEKPFYTGAGTTNFIQSTEYEDEEGKIKRASAKMQYREPIAANGPITASDKHYRSILDETGQLHVTMAGDSNPSGTSRLNARIEYLSTLQLTQGEVESAFRFIVDTALAMAEALSKKVGYFTDVIRCQCACRLDAGPLAPSERAAIESSIGKTISQETAMMLVGIEDVEAEKTRMALDPLSRTSFAAAVGDALNKLTAPGATLEGAARFIGIEQKLIDLLMSGTPGPEQAPSNGSATGTGKIDPKKPEAPPSDRQRGPGVGGPEKLPAPTPATKSAPATSSSGSSAGAGLPISGAK
jgi:hypothetical protein